MASPSRGLFASLRRFLPSRRRAPRVVVQPTPTQPPPAAPLTNAANLLSALAASHPGDANNIPEQPVATEVRPAPPKEEEQFEDVDDEEDSEGDGEQADRVGDGVAAKPGKSKAKKKAKRRTTWVRKLLDQESAAPKDRVHRKKRKPRTDTESGLRRCHVIHTRAVDEHLKLLGCVMNFLEPLQPARRCATVNKVWAAAVAQYYTRYCTPPRPYAFLKQFMFNQEHAKNGLLRRTLEFLSVPDRIHASETSHVFQKVADTLSLAFIGSISANRFLTLISYDRINVRFPQTRKLEFDRVSIVDTARILRYMSESDDEHFVSVTELVFKRLRGIADEKQFLQLIQALFSDSISRQLERLVLSDTSLEDMHFRHLARLFYDGRFPALQHLDISKNAFSSRFMRDWSRCFHEDRFQALRALDISANEIPSHSLTSIADTLFEANCVALHALNLARNGPTRSLVRFQQLTRSHKCPSLACLQVSYAQSESEGYAFVRHVRARMSVEELRRRKQLKFEERMRAIEANNRIKACRAEARCKRQGRCLREMYDHMESEADRALRRRKRVRKSTHLHIHEEIQRLKQDKYHERVCRELERKIKGNVAISV
ncbi:hypothetical protein Poli38472_008438 [Pythium oligandrum]|uniref:Uncharacterized protein n=1 Tax=Pythium oligandrum TaxID=41045 RepID=A0A8K1CLF2_PYTOL|nr:hypothetical protein Poli38472_008438 [Pythium oligandrum]|eukprot:TMW65796.1 hypothetical protein Poli38472_008438 [Pythium oligandrum]